MELAQQKFKFYCPLHPDFKIEFLQVKNLSYNDKYQNLFCCSDCIFQNQNYKHSNYSLIKHIIKSKEGQIVQNWPPVNDNLLIKQLIEISTIQVDIEKVEAEIQKFFSDLKSDLLQEIDVCQKKMIQKVQNSSYNKSDILNKYQELSKISELKFILKDNATDIHTKEQKYRILIQNLLAQKKTMTEQLASLLDEHKKQQINFNIESAYSIKKSILKSIRDIDLFQHNENVNATNPQKLDVKLFATDFRIGKQYQDIRMNENNEYELRINRQTVDWFNTVSNIIMDSQTRYVFRLKIEMIDEEDECSIGFMQDKNINDEHGCYELLSCHLMVLDKCIRKYPKSSYGIDKLVECNEFKLSQENQIEIRLCIKDQVLQVLDYPKYEYKLELQLIHVQAHQVQRSQIIYRNVQPKQQNDIERSFYC